MSKVCSACVPCVESEEHEVETGGAGGVLGTVLRSFSDFSLLVLCFRPFFFFFFDEVGGAVDVFRDRGDSLRFEFISLSWKH